MPMDCTTLMSSSPPSVFSPASYRLSLDPDLVLADDFACRRVSSYPISKEGPHQGLASQKPTSFKIHPPTKSLSEITLHAVASAALQMPPRHKTDDFCSFSSSAPSAATFTFPDSWQLEVENLRGVETKAVVESVEEQEEGSGVRRVKKRVVFADESGQPLCEVRVMREPSDQPPKLDSSVLRQLLGEAACEEARPCATWFLAFNQPASEYLKFRQTLERQNVALENVIIRNEECILLGTVKVRNLCFRKTVFVRLTDNNWSSYQDYPATFSATAAGSAAFDTFSFSIQIPCDDERRTQLAFCICFKTQDGTEFWDSRNGHNFQLLSQKAKLVAPNSLPPARTRTRQNSFDAFTLDHQNWAQFSVLRDLQDPCPFY